MSSIQVIGIDLGKSSFHLIGRDDQNQIAFKKQLTRLKLLQFLANTPSCLIAFEACGGAHWLGRFCKQHDHKVILIPPQYVKPFVKGNKNDFNDAQAIIEAALRPDMKSVPVKTIDQQAMASVHRIRDGFVAERTAVMSRIATGEGPLYDWLRKLRESKPFNKVCVALANKIVRMAYAVLSTRQPYKA